MTLFPEGHRAPREVADAAATHIVRYVAPRLLRGLVLKEGQTIGAALDRTGTKQSVRWWSDEARQAGFDATLMAELTKGFESPSLEGAPAEDFYERYVESGLVGLHFLVRRGDESTFFYFAPPKADTSFVEPYRRERGLKGYVNAKGKEVKGLENVTVSAVVSDSTKQPLGSPLAAAFGAVQYIPDFDRVRDHVPWGDIDLVTRNRSSLYLPLQDANGTILAILILQSAIPNVFGDTVLLEAAEHGKWYESHQVPYKIDADLFKRIRSALLPDAERDELVQYAQLLRWAGAFHETLVRATLDSQKAALRHVQSRVWGFVQQQYKRLMGQPPDDDARIGAILLEHLGAAIDVVSESLDLRRTMEADLADYLRLIQFCRNRLVVSGWKHAPVGKWSTLCNNQCRMGQARQAGSVPILVGLAEPLVSIIYYEMLTNAFGPQHKEDERPAPTATADGPRLVPPLVEVHVCTVACLISKCDDLLLLKPGDEASWSLVQAYPDDHASLPAGNIVLCIADSRPWPDESVADKYQHRHGLRQIATIIRAFRKLGREAYYGFARTKTDHSRKLAFFIFPEPEEKSRA